MKDDTLNLVDIYCGAGGLSEGFHQAHLQGMDGQEYGFSLVYGFDKDKDAMTTYRQNHFRGVSGEQIERVAPRRSVVGLSGDEILRSAGVDRIHILVGGPNCQGVSAAGLRNAGDPRNLMFREYRRLVSELRPEWFVMENVPGLAHANNRELLREIMVQLSAIPGYRVSADVLLAAQFGCSQYRYRLFVIGTLTDAPIRFPNPAYRQFKHGQLELLSSLPPYRTVEQAFGDLTDILPTVRFDRPLALEDGKTVHNHVVPDVEPENRQRISEIGQGEDWRAIHVEHLPERYFATRACDQRGAYGRLAWQSPAYTVTASASNVSAGPFTHPSYDRPISVREAARLQGFEDSYIFSGDVNSMYRQIGNAVPPPLARAVAEAVLYCHFRPEEAGGYGHPGRITVELLDECVAGRRSFPVLTPRFPSESRVTRPLRVPSQNTVNVAAPHQYQFAEQPEQRKLVSASELDDVRREAKLPGNVRAGRRARAILGYFEGKPLDELLLNARVSRRSIEKWVDGFYAKGTEGWRAYHTPLAALAGNDTVLLETLSNAVKTVRQHIPAVSSPDLTSNVCEPQTTRAPVSDGRCESPTRPHMNLYLQTLIKRYGAYSVEELIRLVEAKLGQSVGTQYVGDLLAICDVVMSKDTAEKETKIRKPGGSAITDRAVSARFVHEGKS